MKPLQGGHESNGAPLFVARGKVDGVDSIGMVSIPNYQRVNIMQKMINRSTRIKIIASCLIMESRTN